VNRRERMRRALARQPVDRLPTQLNYTARMGAMLAERYGVSLALLPERLDNHLLRVDISAPRRLSADGRITYDWWGAGWDTTQEGYYLVHAPLQERQDLDAIPWPDPYAPGLLEIATQAIAANNGQQFVVPNLGFALFERAWSLRGLESFLADTALDVAYAAELLDRITAIQEVVAQRFVTLGVDAGYFGDDYGAQKGLLMSPRAWRALIKPRLARLFAPFRQAGLPVILHSDGQIEAILPDLIEIGLTVLNPVQPEVLEHSRLSRQYGDALAFYGGISTQTVLPYGTPGDVRAAVRACSRELAPHGTGLVIGPSHRMMTDIPLANVDALWEAISEL